MIGHLKGTVLSIEQDTAIIDVAGVGYEVHATSRLLDRLMPGEAASLSIDTMVREDFIKLYCVWRCGGSGNAFVYSNLCKGLAQKRRLRFCKC